jgi:hypothetical protein
MISDPFKHGGGVLTVDETEDDEWRQAAFEIEMEPHVTSELTQFWEEMDREGWQILQDAEREYAAPDDRFQNFVAIGRIMGVTPHQVAGVYLMKHICAIIKGVSLREDMQGRYVDAMNYLRLMAAMEKFLD